jgi:hypothetical protein
MVHPFSLNATELTISSILGASGPDVASCGEGLFSIAGKSIESDEQINAKPSLTYGRIWTRTKREN